MQKHMLRKHPPIGLLLASVRRRQRQLTEAHLKGLDLSVQQFWVLVALHERAGSCLADLVAILPMDQPTASRVVASLGARGLLTQVSDDRDRRRRRLVLTRKGNGLGPRLTDIAARVRDVVETGFSGREIATLRSFLNRISENLDGATRAVGAVTPRTHKARRST
jgi:DNA-binding MarR family transcriptional regulator